MNFIIKVPVEKCPYMRKKKIIKCKHPKSIGECCREYSTFYDLCPLAGCIEKQNKWGTGNPKLNPEMYGKIK